MDRIEFLEHKANELRQNILTMIYKAQSGHPGGSLSISDIMAALYYDEMKIDPQNPDWSERDRLILSKGHCCPAWYAILAMKGYYPMEILDTLRQFESVLQGHPCMNKVCGVDMTTGSLGQGLSIGVGMALGARYDGQQSRVFVILGDGETNEGQVWEATMTAAKYKLNNLVAIVDRNRLQNDGTTDEIMPTDPMDKKWEAFGWHVVSIDGHCMEDILRGLGEARSVKDKPVCIIARTVKGKGVSFMENVVSWHGTPPNDEQYRRAMEELKGGTAV